jgi:hypothetical protein
VNFLEMLEGLHAKALLIGLIVVGMIGILSVMNAPPATTQSAAANAAVITTNYAVDAIKDIVISSCVVAVIGAFVGAIICVAKVLESIF